MNDEEFVDLAINVPVRVRAMLRIGAAARGISIRAWVREAIIEKAEREINDESAQNLLREIREIES